MTIEDTVELLLEQLGFDVFDNPHLHNTPKRMAEMLKELTTPEEFEFTTFKNTDISHMVTVKAIPFHSLCAHHVLPFYGKAHVAYIPDGVLCGLSKLARTVKYFSRGLNVQEEMTEDIKNYLVEKLEDPVGIGVVVEATHLCMVIRGVETPGLTTTSAMYGAFLDANKGAREEFLSLVRNGG